VHSEGGEGANVTRLQRILLRVVEVRSFAEAFRRLSVLARPEKIEDGSLQGICGHAFDGAVPVGAVLGLHSIQWFRCVEERFTGTVVQTADVCRASAFVISAAAAQTAGASEGMVNPKDRTPTPMLATISSLVPMTGAATEERPNCISSRLIAYPRRRISSRSAARRPGITSVCGVYGLKPSRHTS